VRVPERGRRGSEGPSGPIDERTPFHAPSGMEIRRENGGDSFRSHGVNRRPAFKPGEQNGSSGILPVDPVKWGGHYERRKLRGIRLAPLKGAHKEMFAF